MKRHDWPAIAAEIASYLDSLEPKQRPMPLTNWALVCDVRKSNLYNRHRTNPNCPFSAVYARYRELDELWVSMLGSDLAATQGTGTGWIELADEYGLTYTQVTKLAETCERRGYLKRKRRQPLSLERIIKTARVGMTRKDLADALGISTGRMHSLLRKDRKTGLTARIIWTAKQGNNPTYIKAIVKRNR